MDIGMRLESAGGGVSSVMVAGIVQEGGMATCIDVGMARLQIKRDGLFWALLQMKAQSLPLGKVFNNSNVCKRESLPVVYFRIGVPACEQFYKHRVSPCLWKLKSRNGMQWNVRSLPVIKRPSPQNHVDTVPAVSSVSESPSLCVMWFYNICDPCLSTIWTEHPDLWAMSATSPCVLVIRIWGRCSNYFN